MLAQTYKHAGIGRVENLTVIGHVLHWTVPFVSSDANGLSYLVAVRTPNSSMQMMTIAVVTIPLYDLQSSALPVCDPYVFMIRGFSSLYTGEFSTILVYLPKGILASLLFSLSSVLIFLLFDS